MYEVLNKRVSMEKLLNLRRLFSKTILNMSEQVRFSATNFSREFSCFQLLLNQESTKIHWTIKKCVEMCWFKYFRKNENFQYLFFHFKQPKLAAKLVHETNVPFETATFGMGCFWSVDSLFGATHGVLRTKVGYAGGTKPLPIYKNM